jgi:hypothetical protein
MNRLTFVEEHQEFPGFGWWRDEQGAMHLHGIPRKLRPKCAACLEDGTACPHRVRTGTAFCSPCWKRLNRTMADYRAWANAAQTSAGETDA